MTTRLVLACAALFLLFAIAPQAQRPPLSPLTAIVGARLIDGTGGPAVDNSVVIVNGDHFTAAGPRALVGVPAGATIVDATGKTLIPGLVDAH